MKKNIKVITLIILTCAILTFLWISYGISDQEEKSNMSSLGTHNKNSSSTVANNSNLNVNTMAIETINHKKCLERLESDFQNNWKNNDFSNPLAFVLKDALALFLRSVQLGGNQVAHWNPLLIKVAYHLVSQITHSGIAIFVITNGITPNIQEWVVNYLLLGVEHIIITDDSKYPENSRFLSALQPFVEIGFVSFFNLNLTKESFTGENSFIDRQTRTYQLGLEKYRDNFTWIAFFDTDEYLVFKDPMTNLSSFLANSNAGSVNVKWKIILPWGVPEHNISKTHFEQYAYSSREHHLQFGKSFVHTKRCLNLGIHDCLAFADGTSAISVRDNPMELRHYYFFDLKYGLLEKICGQSEGSQKWYHIRFDNFKTLMERNISSSYTGTEIGQTELRRELYGY